MSCTGYAITIDGETHSQADWCRIYHTHPNTVRSRMDKGMTFEEALKWKPQGRQMLEPPMKEGRKAKPINGGYKAKKSKKCGKCEAVCPQHLEIRKLLEKAADAFEKKE